MSKKLSSIDFVKQLVAQEAQAHQQAGRGQMKLNRPPINTGISTEQLHSKTESESASQGDAMVSSLKTLGSVRLVQLSLIDDSPYQPRLSYNPQKLDELGESLEMIGQAEPVTVRPMGDRFELLGGHRRKRAAIARGWLEIEAVIKECDDITAEKIALVQNEGREDLSDYERAKMYQRALERGFAKTQTELGSMFGCHQSSVSTRLKLLTLPKEVLVHLEKTPDLFGTVVGKIIFDLLKTYPEEVKLIAEGVARMSSADGEDHAKEEVKASSLRSWFLSQLNARKPKSKAKKEVSIITNASGRELFSVKADMGKIQISIAEGTKVDEHTVQKWVLAALRERAEQVDTQE